MASDCESALNRFDASNRIIAITVKLSSIVREIRAVKKECILSLIIVKVDAYQDKVKKWNKLLLLEKLNMECNKEVKRLILQAKDT